MRVILAILLLAAGIAHAQYPERPIRFVVEYPAGGILDTLARRIARHAAERRGWTVVVENKAGASGIIAAADVARTAPDGYTVLGGATAPHALDPGWFTVPSEDHAFRLVAAQRLIKQIYVLAAPAGSRLVNVEQAIAELKRAPAYPTEGPGTVPHIFGLLLDPTGSAVHYRGSPDAARAIATGELQVGFASLGAAMPYIRAGKLRVFGRIDDGESASARAFPRVPRRLFAEQHVAWLAIFLPEGTPRHIVELWNAEAREAMAAQDRAFFEALGCDPAPMSVADVNQFIADERQKYRRIAESVAK